MSYIPSRLCHLKQWLLFSPLRHMIEIKPLFRRLALLARRWPIFNPNHQDALKLAKKITYHRSRKVSSLNCPEMHCCDRRIEEQLSMFKKLPIVNRAGKMNDTSKKPNELDCPVTENGKPRLKPPIILIYTDNRQELFIKLASSLKQTLLADTYTVGHLSLDALENHPWINENCACLLITQTGKYLSARAWSHLQDYVHKGGKIVFLCSNTLRDLLTRLSDETPKAGSNVLANTFKLESDNHWMVEQEFKQFLKNSLLMLAQSNEEVNQGFRSEQCPFSVSLYKKQDQPMLFTTFQKSEKHANAIFTDSTTDDLVDGQHLTHLLERLGVQTQRSSQAPQLTQGYMVFQKDRLLFDIKATLFTSEKDGLPSSAGFDSHQYFSALCTKAAGRALVYLPVCETTLTISKSLSDLFPESDQLIMVAGRQTKGKGRGGNEWISPRGCSMVTFNYNIPMDSEMAKSINFVQHVTAVAAVDAATTLIGDKDFPLKIKWPNDLYYKRSRKMGGVLVSACCRSDRFLCMISCGLNVANSQPNGCVNDFLTSDFHKKLHIEEFIAELMNKFEYHLHLFETRGKEEFSKKYCAMWMHTNEEVSILRADSITEKVVIVGLDSDGYLKVKSKQSGLVFSVQDDGNSFDMLNGLIHTKH